MGVLQTRRGGGIPAHKESRGFPRRKGIPCFFCVFLQNPLTKQPSRVMNSEITTDWRAVMQKSTLPQGVRKLKAWAEKGALAFDLPIQRASGQWSLLQKSLLIHSMLAEYPIPPLYFIKCRTEEGGAQYQALDGKQRCTGIFEFIDGGYALHASTPPVAIDGFTFDLANMGFEDLSEECRDAILGFRFTIYALEDATDGEIEEAFARLNASTPLTLIQKARTEMGTELAGWTKEMTQYPFFTQGVSLTLAQARRESELEILLQSMLLMDAKDEGYNYKAISMGEVMKYCRGIRNGYTGQRKSVIQCCVEYLSDAFTEKHRFLKKSNAPMAFVMADMAMGQGIPPEGFREFIDYFGEHVSPAYEANMGSGNIKRAKTEGRLLAIYDGMREYFNIPDGAAGYPVYVGGLAGSQPEKAQEAEKQEESNVESGRAEEGKPEERQTAAERDG